MQAAVLGRYCSPLIRAGGADCVTTRGLQQRLPGRAFKLFIPELAVDGRIWQDLPLGTAPC